MSLHTQNEDIVEVCGEACFPHSGERRRRRGRHRHQHRPERGLHSGLRSHGGSSVSENVSPLNLINVKKVGAYGLKNCATLLQDDKSFCHPDLGRTAAPAAECCSQRPLDFSPADIVASFERRQGCPSCGAAVQESSIDTPEQLKNASQGFTDDAHLAELVRNLIASMNH